MLFHGRERLNEKAFIKNKPVIEIKKKLQTI